MYVCICMGVHACCVTTTILTGLVSSMERKDPHIGHRTIVLTVNKLMTFRGFWRICFEEIFLKQPGLCSDDIRKGRKGWFKCLNEGQP